MTNDTDRRTRQPDEASGAASDRTVLGSLRVEDGSGVVRIEDRFDTAIDDLWSALTDPDRLARWYGTVQGELRAGGEYRVHLESAGLHGAGRIEVCDPPRRLRVVTNETEESWRPGDGGQPFDESIEATLTSDGANTVLVIEARGMPLDKIAFYGAGWQIHVEHLAAYLAGDDLGDEEARWGALVPPYQEVASAIS